MPTFPSRDDGPQGRTWAPAVPACGASTMNGRAFKFSVQTEDGVTHRFLLSRKDALWLALSFMRAVFPRPLSLVFSGYRPMQRSQSPMSSGMPSADGSPQEGQAL